MLARPQTLHRFAIGFSLVAFALACTLALQSAGQAKLPGCSDHGGCTSVLQSHYALLLGLPVTLFSLGFYALTTATLLVTSPPRKVATEEDGKHDAQSAAAQSHSLSQTLLVFAAVVAIGAGVYFTTIQAAVLHAFCPYCCATHAFGLLMGLAILAAKLPKLPARKRVRPIALGLAAVGSFAFIQTTFPSQTDVAAPLRRASFSDTGPDTDPNRILTFPSVFEGTGVRLNPRDLPIHGNPNAPVIALLASDYTCGFCSLTHQAMAAALAQFPNQLAIATVPVARPAPGTPGSEAHDDAASEGRIAAPQLRDLALAVHLAAPEHFAAFDDALFAVEPGQFMPVADARALAESFVDPSTLDATLQSPELAQLRERLTKLHEVAGGTYPLLIVENQIWPGAPLIDPAQIPAFVQALAQLASLESPATPGSDTAPEANTGSQAVLRP